MIHFYRGEGGGGLAGGGGGVFFSHPPLSLRLFCHQNVHDVLIIAFITAAHKVCQRPLTASL